jgi:tRNA pseudouridine55 synthase
VPTVEPGIILAHKPRGATSFSLCAELKTLAVTDGHKMSICHGGALDPFAHGLLLLLVGPATRLMDELHAIPKKYEAEIVWGAETDTGDAGGRVVMSGDASGLAPALLEARLAEMLGWHDQIPPMTSNKRVDGERAYLRAHRGETFSLPPSRVYLHEASFTAHDLPRRSHLSLTCRGGYYVRSLARDLGRAVGCGAHLSELRRTEIGPWRDPGPDWRLTNPLSNSIPTLSIRGEALLPWLPSRQLTHAEANAVELRRPIPRGEIALPTFNLPNGFPGPGAAEHERPAPIRGICDGQLRLLLRARGNELVLATDLDGGI